MKAASSLTIFSAGIAAAVVTPHFVHSAASFLSGVCFTGICIVAALSSRKRLRQVAKALNAIAAIASQESAPAVKVPRVEETGLQAELVSALMNIGAKRGVASKAAAQAISSTPGAEFAPTFTAAVRLLQN